MCGFVYIILVYCVAVCSLCGLMARPLQEISHSHHPPSPNRINHTGKQEIPDNTHTSDKLHVTPITIYQYYKHKATHNLILRLLTFYTKLQHTC